MISYNNKKFRAKVNSENGETSDETIFYYRQDGNIITAKYNGGKIVRGVLMGNVDANGNIELSYHHLNDEGIIMTGICHSTPEVLSNDKIRLHESWQWTSGDLSKGTSIIEEI